MTGDAATQDALDGHRPTAGDAAPLVAVFVCGEPLRGDDGIAFAAADELPEGISAMACIHRVGGLAVDDLVHLAPGTPCVIVDAVLGPPAGHLVVRALEHLGREPRLSPTSGHQLPLPEVLALATALGWRPLGTFLGVGGTSFELGAPMSSPVVAAVPRLRAAIALEVARLGGQPAAPWP